jgi:hypothetical protein
MGKYFNSLSNPRPNQLTMLNSAHYTTTWTKQRALQPTPLPSSPSSGERMREELG